MAEIQSIEAIILAGGKGTRLSTVVSDVPKPLAPVGGKPFLNFILDSLAHSKIVSRAVLSIGHQAEKVTEYYAKNPHPLPLQFISENKPLGTGGAVLYSMHNGIQGERFLVLNGDSVVRVDIKELLKHHMESGALASLVLLELSDTRRYGTVHVKDSRVTAFLEKRAEGGPGLINAGVYLFEKRGLESFAVEPCSIETLILPKLIESGFVRAEITSGPFIDIGLPETYRAAEEFFKNYT